MGFRFKDGTKLSNKCETAKFFVRKVTMTFFFCLFPVLCDLLFPGALMFIISFFYCYTLPFRKFCQSLHAEARETRMRSRFARASSPETKQVKIMTTFALNNLGKKHRRDLPMSPEVAMLSNLNHREFTLEELDADPLLAVIVEDRRTRRF